MNGSAREIERSGGARDKVARLKHELESAKRALREAEADLAQEQADVNAFRMHCRLKLDVLVDMLLELHAQKQSQLTRLRLLRQAQDLGIPYDEADPFWTEEEPPEQEEEIDLLLPTPTPTDKAAEKRLYRELARRFHPDLAETAVERAYRTSIMAAINVAYDANDLQALYDLAGELDPAEAAELAGIETKEIRRLREYILKCRQLRRKAQRQLQGLRQENTARLWQRAQALDQGSEDYWSLVRRELQEAINRRTAEVAALREEVAALEAAQAQRHAPESKL